MAELDYDALREAAETALEAGRQHSFIVPTSLYRFHDAFTPSVGVALLDRVRELEAERDAALSTIAKVREAVSGHPECDRYEDGDAITCGWKNAYASVVWALEEAPEVES